MQEPFIFNLFETFTLQVYQTSRESNVTDLKGFFKGGFLFEYWQNCVDFLIRFQSQYFGISYNILLLDILKLKLLPFLHLRNNCTMKK
jgi:hypothetical protein